MAHTTTPPVLHVLLTGGGTGGHVFPALAVADELVKRGHQVSFAGSAHGLEAQLVARHGLPFHAVAARPLVGRGTGGKLLALGTLATSAVRARSLCRRLGVDAVLGTGGYVSAPAVLGARLAGRPVLLLEPNAHTGVANRWLSRFCQEAAVTYPATVAELRCPARVTGAPVRPSFFAVEPLPEMPRGTRVLVLGGSQGAQQINRLMPEAVARAAAAVGAVEVLHQSGAGRDQETAEAYRRALEALPEATRPRIHVVPFLDDVAGAMERSHLLVSRAGALTLAEICAAGRPSLLVPLAAALAHQLDNARTLEEAGAAKVVDGAEADAAKLAAALEELLAAGPRLAAMGRAARDLAHPGAAAVIADRVEALAKGVAA